MITNISLQNFKCFRKVSLDSKLITVLIGPNGTGKTAVLQALLLLKQSRLDTTRLSLDDELIRFAPEALVLRGTDLYPKNVRLTLSMHSHIDSEEIHGPVNFYIDLEYSEQATLVANRGSTEFIVNNQVYFITFDSNSRRHEVRTPEGRYAYIPEYAVNSFHVGPRQGEIEPSLSTLDQLSHAPAEALARLKVVPAARGLTRGVYALGPVSHDDIFGTRGLGEQEENTVTTLAYSRNLVETVSILMRQITGVGFRVDTVPPQSAKPVSESLAGDISLSAEGFGTNALVHLLFELIRTVPGATTLIEEPEIHLHPRAQAELASVLAEEAKAGRKQLILTTHSEHIAGRLLTLVAEGKLSADELSIYSFEKDKQGVCTANKIEVTDKGQVRGGLRGFFETDLDEMRRYVEALRAKA